MSEPIPVLKARLNMIPSAELGYAAEKNVRRHRLRQNLVLFGCLSPPYKVNGGKSGKEDDFALR